MVEVKVNVSKEAYELMLGIAGFCGAVKQALSDGWQPTQDLPAVMTAAIAHLVPTLEGIVNLPAEAVSETPEFAKALAIGAAEIYGALKKG